MTIPGVLAIAFAIPLLASAAPAQMLTPTDKPLAGKTIAIDPGHNGRNGAHPEVINKLVPAGGFKKACDTTGTATNDGQLSESSFNLDVAKRVRKLLEDKGAKVVMTRANNRGVGPCVNKRAEIGNDAHADAAISIHGDGARASGHGFHVILPGLVPGYTEAIVMPSRKLGRQIRDSLQLVGLKTSTYAGRKGLDTRKDLGGLNLSTVPKVLVELGNMRNASDARHMEDPKWRQKVAESLAGSLYTYVIGPVTR